jgi:hypothetical protein
MKDFTDHPAFIMFYLVALALFLYFGVHMIGKL